MIGITILEPDKARLVITEPGDEVMSRSDLLYLSGLIITALLRMEGKTIIGGPDSPFSPDADDTRQP